MTERLLERCLGEALSAGGDFADLYFEAVTSTSLAMDEGIVKTAAQGVSVGCGVRVLSGERTGFAYTDDLSAERLLKAARTAALIASGPQTTRVAGFNENARAAVVSDCGIVGRGDQREAGADCACGPCGAGVRSAHCAGAGGVE